MITKDEMITKARECGLGGPRGHHGRSFFEPAGNPAGAGQGIPVRAYRSGLDLMAGTDPRSILPDARSILVLMEVYFRSLSLGPGTSFRPLLPG